jgi:GlpG protein
LILVTAVLSNLTELAYMNWYVHQLYLAGGLSGVVYALFGYVWVKGETEPEQGLAIDSQTVMFMLFWLFLCMTGAVGNVANASHVGGLVAGVAVALSRF